MRRADRVRISYRLTTFLAFTALCAAISPAHSAEVNWIDDVDKAWATTQSQGRPLLVFITKDRCKYCTKMKQATYQDKKVAALINDRFVPVQLDRKQATDLVTKLGIRAFPTTVVITPDAKVADKIKGYLPPAKFNKRLAATVSRGTTTVQRK